MQITPQNEQEMFFDGASRIPTGAQKEDVQDNVIKIEIVFVFRLTMFLSLPHKVVLK